MATSAAETAHPLPLPRGELSATVVESLSRPPQAAGSLIPTANSDADPYGDDLQLTLHICYELHYQGFDEVHPRWEWDPDLLRLRAGLERSFLDAMCHDVAGGSDVEAELGRIPTQPVASTGIGQYLLDEGQWWQVREYLVHRSIYHHKEADPYVWVIPRLCGQEKASLVAVEFDEFGCGHGERMHAQLYADLLDGAGLHSEYLYYLDAVRAPMLAVVNMMSLFGLHRALRGALVGHFATVEIGAPPVARRMVDTLRRFDADPACVQFYTEHVETHAVHEQVLRNGVIEELLTRQPGLAADMVLGIQATKLLEARFNNDVLQQHWLQGQSSLRGGELIDRAARVDPN